MTDKNIQMKHHNGVDWDNLYPKTKGEVVTLSDGKTLSVKVSEIESSIGNKVDKVSGKGLSTNDFTNELKTKLNSLENGSIPVSKVEPTDSKVWFEEL